MTAFRCYEEERSLCLTALHDKPVSFLLYDVSVCIDS